MCKSNLLSTVQAPELARLRDGSMSKAEYFTRLINGNFNIALPPTSDRESELDSTLSYLFGLCKTFELRYVSDRIYAKPRAEQCDALISLGQLAHVFLHQLSDMLETMVKEEAHDPHAPSLQSRIYKYFADRTDEHTQEILFVSYLALLIGAHDQFVVSDAGAYYNAKPIPWEVMPNRRNSHIRLVHRRKMINFQGDKRFINKAVNYTPYVLIRFPEGEATAIRQMMNFAGSYRTTAANRREDCK